MEQLFNGNNEFVYFILLLFFIKPNNLKENQKVFFVYIITLMVDSMNIIKSLHLYLLMLLILLLDIEFFSNSKFRQDALSNSMYRIIDFIYLMICQYGLIRYTFLLFLNTYFFSSLIKSCHIYVTLIICMKFLICLNLMNYLYYVPWKICELDIIKNKMDKIVSLNYLPDQMCLSNYQLVSLLEDKSFFHRKKYGTIFSIDFLKNYYIPRFINKMKRVNITALKEEGICASSKKCKKRLKSMVRGYSTIEAQLIRSIGIERGYNSNKINIIKRKIFEIVYSNLVFNNLYKFYGKNLYVNLDKMKLYIMYIYLHYARVELNGKKCIGLKELYEKPIEHLTDKEIFIGVLAFSDYHLNVETIIYKSKLYNFDLSEEECTNILNGIH